PATDPSRLALFGKVAPLVGLDETVHLAKRRDAGNRVLAIGPAVGDSAEQLVVDVNGAARHAGDDPGPFEVEAGQPAQHHVAAGAGILQHADPLGLEGLQAGALHDGAAITFHSGPDVINLPEGLGLAGRSPTLASARGGGGLGGGLFGWFGATAPGAGEEDGPYHPERGGHR